MKLWQQIFIGLILGVLAGIFFKHDAVYLKPLGTLFINMIKMVVIPLIIFALISGITSMDDSRSFTRVGLKGIGAYLTTAMFAVIMGIAAGLVFKPGSGLNIHIGTLTEGSASLPKAKEAPSIAQFLMDLIPTNIVRAMAEDNFLQIVIFSVFTGIIMNVLGEKSRKAREILQEFAQIAFKMIEVIVKLAPIAVFGFIAWMVGTQGLDVIETLAKLMVVVVGTCVIQYMLFGIMIVVFARLNPLPFYRKLITTQSMAFATSSSKATLTTAMRELNQKLGVSEKSTNFLMPLGACINMDGTAIYLGICAVFFSQVFNVPLQTTDYLVLIITCTLGSIGAAGIPSGSIIFMSMVLNSVGLPLEGITLILGIDRLLDMVRTTINITGDSAITLIIDKTEDQLDVKRYYAFTKKLESAD